ncbi:MAG: hypothetical protein ACKVPX_18945 [Myxococcaceae bacterium]
MNDISRRGFILKAAGVAAGAGVSVYLGTQLGCDEVGAPDVHRRFILKAQAKIDSFLAKYPPGTELRTADEARAFLQELRALVIEVAGLTGIRSELTRLPESPDSSGFASATDLLDEARALFSGHRLLNLRSRGELIRGLEDVLRRGVEL